MTETLAARTAEVELAVAAPPLGADASPSSAILALDGYAQRLAVVRTFSMGLAVSAAIGSATFAYYGSARAGDDAEARVPLLLVIFFAACLSLSGIVARRLCRNSGLRAATYLMAVALIIVGTTDLVLIAGIQAIGILIYCVAIGIAALGLDTREWPWFTAMIGTSAAVGSVLQYFPIVAQVQLSDTFLAIVTVVATTFGLCFPMGLFWMFSKSLTASQAHAWQLAQSLGRANHLKSEFLNTMSHELRSPLHVIIGNAAILQESARGPWTGEHRHLLERITKYAVELLRLVQSTLDLSRIENGRMPMHIERFTFEEILAEVQEAIAPLRKSDTVTLGWSVEPNLPELLTDRLKLKEVIQNLVTNAVKFTPNGRIETAVTGADAAAVIVVRDTGVGIPPEDLSLIFESFAQSPSFANGQFGGVGLGLYIVNRLTELLGGTIDVESVLGAGTTFRVRVPLRHPSTEESGGAGRARDGGT